MLAVNDRLNKRLWNSLVSVASFACMHVPACMLLVRFAVGLNSGDRRQLPTLLSTSPVCHINCACYKLPCTHTLPLQLSLLSCTLKMWRHLTFQGHHWRHNFHVVLQNCDALCVIFNQPTLFAFNAKFCRCTNMIFLNLELLTNRFVSAKKAIQRHPFSNICNMFIEFL